MASRPSSRTGASQPAMHPAAAAIRRNLFSNSTASTSSASLFAPPPQQSTHSFPPSAPSRRPPSRPVSRTAAHIRPQPQTQTTSTASIPATLARQQSSHAHATQLTARPSSSRSTSRPTSRARPRSRALRLDGTSDERDVRPEMYEDAQGQGHAQAQPQSHRPQPHKLTRTYSSKPMPQEYFEQDDAADDPESEEDEEPESPGILISDADVQEVEGRVYMADGELEQLTQMAMHGLKHEDADGDEEMHEQEQFKAPKITTTIINGARLGRERGEQQAVFNEAVVEELRGMVAGLEDDRWMYEEESEGEDSDG